MKTKQEIRDWLLANAVNKYGSLVLNGLDFSDFDGDIYISGMQVKKNLYQNTQEVGGNLYQDRTINFKTKAKALEEVEKMYE